MRRKQTTKNPLHRFKKHLLKAFDQVDQNFYATIGDKILDVGCRRGKLYKKLQSWNHKITSYMGTDIDSVYLDFARALHPECSWELATESVYESIVCNTIVFRYSIHHCLDTVPDIINAHASSRGDHNSGQTAFVSHFCPSESFYISPEFYVEMLPQQGKYKFRFPWLKTEETESVVSIESIRSTFDKIGFELASHVTLPPFPSPHYTIPDHFWSTFHFMHFVSLK